MAFHELVEWDKPPTSAFAGNGDPYDYDDFESPDMDAPMHCASNLPFFADALAEDGMEVFGFQSGDQKRSRDD